MNAVVNPPADPALLRGAANDLNLFVSVERHERHVAENPVLD
jgi:hypothetical protein